MYYSVYFLLMILFGHFVADFISQDRKTANEKSSSLFVLAKHCLQYSLLLWLSCAWYKTLAKEANGLPLQGMLYWVIFNSFCHFVIDYFTSRSFKAIWPYNQYFAVCIVGFDQFLHVFLLFLTFPMFVNA